MQPDVATSSPWRASHERDVARTLDATVAFLRRFVVLSDEQLAAVALWTFHTHAIDAAEVTAYLHARSPEKRSGKTRLLEALELLVRAPLPSVNISDAALFRAIDERSPTLLMDEIDAIFGPKARDREDLRGLINAGYRRGASAFRMGGPKMTTLQEFKTFCPKVLAGIGRLPDTIEDRSVTIGLVRKTRAERVERFRRRDAMGDAEPIRQSLESLASYHVPALTEARPELPEALSDRAQDSWEPLLAIADLAGDDWSERARRAAVSLSSDEDVIDDTLGVRLLGDIRIAFAANGDRLSTAALLEALKSDEEAPWADWKGTGLSAKRLAELLRPHGIKSRNIRLPDGTTPKGYRLEQFSDTFDRYLPPVNAPFSRHNATTRMGPSVAAISEPPQEGNVAGTKEASNPHEHSVVAGVAGESGDNVRELESGRRERAAREAEEDAAEVERIAERYGNDEEAF